MGEKSSLRSVPVGREILYALALVAMFLGCEFLKKNPQLLPSQPLASTINFDFLRKKTPTLMVGQSEEEVRVILGNPSGTMVVKDQTLLMYDGGILEFEDGYLVTSDTNLLTKMMETRRSSPKKSSRSERR